MSKKAIFYIVIILVGIIVFQRSGCSTYIKSFGHPTSDTLVVHDTTWSVHDSLIYSKPLPAKIIHDSTFIQGKTEYLADTNYAALKIQFDNLVKMYTALAIYVDSVKLDTLGYVSVTDSVRENRLIGRSWKYNYKIPFVTKTVTINNYAVPKTQLYVGGGIAATKTLAIDQVKAGVMLKTKADKVYGLDVNYNLNNGISYGFQTFWKIKLK